MREPLDLTEAVEMVMDHGLSRAKAMTVITRAAPLIERQVRERIAAEIEAWGETDWTIADGARIARGAP